MKKYIFLLSLLSVFPLVDAAAAHCGEAAYCTNDNGKISCTPSSSGFQTTNMEVHGNPTWVGYLRAVFVNAQSYPVSTGGVPIIRCNYSSYTEWNPNNYVNVQWTAYGFVPFTGVSNHWQHSHGYDYCYGTDWRSTGPAGDPMHCQFIK